MRKQILDLQLRHWLYPGWDLQEKLRWHRESGLSVRAPRFATMRTSIALRRPSSDWGIVWKLQYGAPSLWCEIEVWKKPLDCYGGKRNGRVFLVYACCVYILVVLNAKEPSGCKLFTTDIGMRETAVKTHTHYSQLTCRDVHIFNLVSTPR